MPLYTYKVRDREGALLSSQVEAETDADLARRLRAIGYTVISIEKETQFRLHFINFWQRVTGTHKYELLFFSRQLASLLRSGISMTTALSSIAGETRSKILKKTIEDVLEDIQGGATFSSALAKHPHIFSELYTSMVRTGETAGILEEVLERLAELKTQELEIKTRIKSAMAYPMILVGLSIAIVSFLMVNIVPKFVVIFETYEARLPIPTQILLALSLIIRKSWYIIFSAGAICIYAILRYVRTGEGRYRFDRFLLKVPLFGQLYLKVVMARFARTLGALIRTGVPMLQALSVTNKTVANSVINRVIDNVYSAITEGQSLTEPLKASGVFPSTMVQMMSLGERSGNLDKMLSEIADFYEREVDYAIKNLTTALEPALLIGMGTMVAFIALSILLPIFNLIKIFRR